MLHSLKHLFYKITAIGILGFGLLFYYASTLYPGGSQHDSHSIGFDWFHNYWCNLLNHHAINGLPNSARPIAIFAMALLCLSLFIFFLSFASTYVKNKLWKKIITVGGFFSMVTALLLFTDYHDLMTTISSICGILVVIGIIKSIYQSNLHAYKVSGFLCILLLVLNNYIYYTEHFIYYLPLVQKITFAAVLSWVLGLNFTMMKSKNNEHRIDHGNKAPLN